MNPGSSECIVLQNCSRTLVTFVSFVHCILQQRLKCLCVFVRVILLFIKIVQLDHRLTQGSCSSKQKINITKCLKWPVGVSQRVLCQSEGGALRTCHLKQVVLQ